MPKVICVNDKPETIFSTKDFAELIEKNMGYESRCHYTEQIKELSDTIRDLANYIDDSDICSEIEEVLSVNGYE